MIELSPENYDYILKIIIPLRLGKVRKNAVFSSFQVLKVKMQYFSLFPADNNLYLQHGFHLQNLKVLTCPNVANFSIHRFADPQRHHLGFVSLLLYFKLYIVTVI